MQVDDPEDEEAARERETAALKQEALKSCHFVQKTYKTQPMLVSLSHGDQHMLTFMIYRGQDYDRSQWQLVLDGWNHEHCFICWKKIMEGDTYWSNTGRSQVNLCEECYAQNQQRAGQQQGHS